MELKAQDEVISIKYMLLFLRLHMWAWTILLAPFGWFSHQDAKEFGCLLLEVSTGVLTITWRQFVLGGLENL